MRYEHFEELEGLVQRKLISCRQHPTLPLFIYNYTAGAQSLPIKEWSKALCDCRGLILDADGEVVGRPFAKFWNYEQVLDQVPSDLPLTVWEKLDGSLGIVCNYRGSLVVATRGSFESEQARWAQGWLNTNAKGWLPIEGLTYLFEIIYPENRIVVDYGEVRELRLLAVMEADGKESLASFYAEDRFPKAKGYPPNTNLCQQSDNAEGYVLRWSNGFRAKVKFEEYCRLHRLITQVSTRSIWELLRAGKSTEELIDRVPDSFRDWVNTQISQLKGFHLQKIEYAFHLFHQRPYDSAHNRRSFAEWAKRQSNQRLLFALYDRRSIADMVWRMIEPKWATPFKGGGE